MPASFLETEAIELPIQGKLALDNWALLKPFLVCVPRFTSVSLKEACETQDDGGSENPAHDNLDHTQPLRETVRYPSITQVEAGDGKEEVQGIEEGLEGWLDIRLVGGCQVAY